MELSGVAGAIETYWIHVPQGCGQAEAEGEGIGIRATRQGRILALEATFQRAEADLWVRLPDAPC
jgi:hypothetical protein